MQLGRGRVHGYMAHLSIGDLPVDVGDFSVGMRSRGVLNAERITIGMLTGCTDRVMQGSIEMRRGDVMVTPPRKENERSYHGGASYIVISLSSDDIASFFQSEPRLRDIGFWRRAHYRAAPSSDFLIRFLHAAISHQLKQGTVLRPEATEFWKRSFIEIMTSAAMAGIEADSDGHPALSLKIVRNVEDYLDQAGMNPLHISELCGALNVSRRTLHRAFHDALGMGPVAFLQHKRLCSIHSALRACDPATTTIAEIALQHGFLNLGRFSGYYRALFDEYPSETFGKRASRRSRGPTAISTAAAPALRSMASPR